MNSKKLFGRKGCANQFINPVEIKTLNPEEFIIVNRVALNGKRVQIEYVSHAHSERTKAIVDKASQQLRDRDKKQKNSAFGVVMTAGDAITVFTELESLPKNTFMRYAHNR